MARIEINHVTKQFGSLTALDIHYGLSAVAAGIALSLGGIRRYGQSLDRVVGVVCLIEEE